MSEEKFRKFLLSKGYVKRFLVVIDLPTEYTGSRTAYEYGESVKEVKSLRYTSDVVKEFRRLRTRFYSVLKHIAWRLDIGWVLREGTDISNTLGDVLDELGRLSSELSIKAPSVKVVEVLVPTEYLVRDVRKYIEEKILNLERIKEKFNEYRKSKKAIKKLKHEMNEVLKEISDIINEYSSIDPNLKEYLSVVAPYKELVTQ